jgi:hypothetical protein
MTSVGTVISYPIPAYSNVPIKINFYQPSRFVISDVVLGTTTTITTIDDMNYLIGQEVRVLIPPGYGCVQINGISGYVLSIPDTNQVETSIDSSQNVDPFIDATERNQPQIVAIGDINTGIISASGRNIPTTNIPGAFINISPE